MTITIIALFVLFSCAKLVPPERSDMQTLPEHSSIESAPHSPGDRYKQATPEKNPPTSMEARAQPSPIPHNESISAVDRIVERMNFGNIAFNAPRFIQLNDTRTSLINPAMM